MEPRIHIRPGEAGWVMSREVSLTGLTKEPEGAYDQWGNRTNTHWGKGGGVKPILGEEKQVSGISFRIYQRE